MLPVYSNDKSFISKSYGSGIKDVIHSWLRLIFSDTNSRNLFCFLILNLSFAFVELFYGIWTNSLGLISDAFHMFFDCTALLAGLAASVIMKWRPNERFTYGYVRAEVLAGFVNGLFLVFIAFFIFSEAVERLFEPPEVKHERLFIISFLGLLVNLVGIFVFQHGGGHHGHSHGGDNHGHSHSHSHSEPKPTVTTNNHFHGNALLNQLPKSSAPTNYIDMNGHGGHGHSHGGSGNGHGHSHGGHSHDDGHSHSDSAPVQSQILQGVFLHILADTLGSVGVIISALLMSNFGWMIADPICSMFIAILVAGSVFPLLRDSIHVIMQRTPRDIEHKLSDCYARVKNLEGVYNVHDAHFWTLSSDNYVGSIRIECSRTADYQYIQSSSRSIFNSIGVKTIYIEIDYALS